jgi:hypothetical protein
MKQSFAGQGTNDDASVRSADDVGRMVTYEGTLRAIEQAQSQAAEQQG